MNRAEAVEFAKEQRAIFGGRMGEFLKFVEDELSQTNASNTLNALDSVDLISRQAAIEAILKEANSDGAFGYIDAEDAEKVLNALPSAQRKMSPTGKSVKGEEE